MIRRRSTSTGPSSLTNRAVSLNPPQECYVNESTLDRTCHGPRFGTEGEALNGPALAGPVAADMGSS
jgi:hypothetical protein